VERKHDERTTPKVAKANMERVLPRADYRTAILLSNAVNRGTIGEKLEVSKRLGHRWGFGMLAFRAMSMAGRP